MHYAVCHEEDMMNARRVLMGLIMVLALIQFVPVTRSNPPVVDGIVFTDPNALAIAQKACFDCHSNETVWPWYAYVAPFSWWTINHVNEGRATLNFSDIAGTIAHSTHHHDADDEDPITGATLAEHSAEHIEEGEMPPAYYTLIHSDAKLTDAEKQTLITGITQALANR
jgi:hypothetical protein